MPKAKYDWKEEEVIDLFRMNVPENFKGNALKTNLNLVKMCDHLRCAINLLPDDNELENKSEEMIEPGSNIKFSYIYQLKRKNINLWNIYFHKYVPYTQDKNNDLCEQIRQQLEKCTILMEISFKNEYKERENHPFNIKHIDEVTNSLNKMQNNHKLLRDEIINAMNEALKAKEIFEMWFNEFCDIIEPLALKYQHYLNEQESKYGERFLYENIPPIDKIENGLHILIELVLIGDDLEINKNKIGIQVKKVEEYLETYLNDRKIWAEFLIGYRKSMNDCYPEKLKEEKQRLKEEKAKEREERKLKNIIKKWLKTTFSKKKIRK